MPRLDAKKRQGIALPSLQLTTYETQSPQIVAAGALSFTSCPED